MLVDLVPKLFRLEGLGKANTVELVHLHPLPDDFFILVESIDVDYYLLDIFLNQSHPWMGKLYPILVYDKITFLQIVVILAIDDVIKHGEKK